MEWHCEHPKLKAKDELWGLYYHDPRSITETLTSRLYVCEECDALILIAMASSIIQTEEETDKKGKENEKKGN